MTRESKDRIGKWVGVVVGVFGLGFGGVVGAPKCSELETRAHAASTYVTREDAVTEHSQAHTERSLMHLQITELQRSNDKDHDAFKKQLEESNKALRQSLDRIWRELRRKDGIE